jgi:hypothetical protein
MTWPKCWKPKMETMYLWKILRTFLSLSYLNSHYSSLTLFCQSSPRNCNIHGAPSWTWVTQ